MGFNLLYQKKKKMVTRSVAPFPWMIVACEVHTRHRLTATLHFASFAAFPPFVVNLSYAMYHLQVKNNQYKHLGL